MSPTRICVSLSMTILLLAGCASPRLEGPLYLADDAPWIAEGLSGEAEAIELRHRVLLIGDAGLFLDEDPTLLALGRWAAEAPSSSVLFLGDNVYNQGLVDDDRETGERVLTQLLSSTPSPKLFIPGNHDWGFSPKGQNLRAILNQQAYIEAWSDGSAGFLPRDGCMGPEKRILHTAAAAERDIVLVALDPTPWINPLLREACKQADAKATFLALLEQELALHADDFVLVVSHYPMRTGGPHGGLTYGVLGDMITGILAWSWGGLMNTDEPGYADWIHETQAVFRKNPPLAYAAGHDHNLQLLDADDFAGIEIVSGAGARDRVSTVTNIPPTLFAHAAEGFVVVDFGTRDDQEIVVLRIVEAAHRDPVFEMDLR